MKVGKVLVEKIEKEMQETEDSLIAKAISNIIWDLTKVKKNNEEQIEAFTKARNAAQDRIDFIKSGKAEISIKFLDNKSAEVTVKDEENRFYETRTVKLE